MSTISLMQEFVESLRSPATVKSVFGEPTQMEGKTVVPIAKVAYLVAPPTSKRSR